MMMVGITVWIIFCLVLIGWMVWMDEQLYREPYIEEFDAERKCREIKRRLADIELRRKNDKFN
tara:strand:- start:802 stop:990 length:189 start_codon:yes stop_codon:yes gene_type:complete